MIYLVLRSPCFDRSCKALTFSGYSSEILFLISPQVASKEMCVGQGLAREIPERGSLCNRLRHTRHPELIYSPIV